MLNIVKLDINRIPIGSASIWWICILNECEAQKEFFMSVNRLTDDHCLDSYLHKCFLRNENALRCSWYLHDINLANEFARINIITNVPLNAVSVRR